MFRLIAMCLTGLLASSDAFAQSTPYTWQGPYPYGMDQAEIDGIIDHFQAIYSPTGPAPTTADRRFVKFQLSTGFACWKYDSLCDNFGPARAGQFLGDYVALLRRLPTKAEYEDAYGALITYYTNLASTSQDYSTSVADHDMYVGAYQYFYGFGNNTMYPMPVSLNSGGVSVHVGRARYIVGGHSWANAVAVPKDGATATVNATFRQQSLDLSQTAIWDSPIMKSKSATNKAVVTGPFRTWVVSGLTPSLQFSIVATGSAHLASGSDSLTGNLN